MHQCDFQKLGVKNNLNDLGVELSVENSASKIVVSKVECAKQ